ncbi:hypothetical protein [Phytohabitans houttuyneae]|uniref:Uncharacterized protein n=1 Tax=Phytohabitans houttuyneae TaxID=1076126 RepID=A0A6V8KL18_9ACTN|nr:hypothetical protein [Phytohabitans houttuyneae]GFJ85793.1 hypothetical protein Phou_099730 [Phytohabitans houttuyneae]
MTTRTPLPTTEAVAQAHAAMLAECTAQGTRPTVVELARRLGLTNPTFWRHFPDTARDVAAARRNPGHGHERPGRLQRLEDENARLRHTNRELTTTLELAESVIQRLTTDNHRLRQELESINRVTRISDRRLAGTEAAEVGR